MKFKWTDAQEEAVYADISNTLVTAAAGSGKTQVLTGRILERIKAACHDAVRKYNHNTLVLP